MTNASQANHRHTRFTSFAISGIIPMVAICLGFMLTPPAKYNEVMGGLIPVCVFGFYDAVAAAFSFCVTFPIMGSARLKSLPMPFRVLIALLISGCACAGAVCFGLEHMMGLTGLTFVDYGVYQWRVRGKTSLRIGTWSEFSTFTLRPPLTVPLLTINSGDSGSLVFRWASTAGWTYQLQSTVSLATGSWEEVGTPVVGTGDVAEASLTPVSGQHFFRLAIQ